MMISRSMMHPCIHIRKIANGYIVELPRNIGNDVREMMEDVMGSAEYSSDPELDRIMKQNQEQPQHTTPINQEIPVQDHLYAFDSFDKAFGFIKEYLNE